MDILADIKTWQDGLSGLATLAAGAIAYKAVMKQIRSDRELAVAQQRHREKAFLTVIQSSIQTYLMDLEDLENEVSQIRLALSTGINLMARLPHLIDASEFDVSLIEDWGKYQTFSIDMIASIRNFYDAYRHQKRLLNFIHLRAVPELPLLRVVNSDDFATGSLHAAVGSLIVAISATRTCLDRMGSEIEKAKIGGTVDGVDGVVASNGG